MSSHPSNPANLPSKSPEPISVTIKTRLKELPPKPGVYFHKNAQNEIIYIGKAAILKNRVRQYFQNSPKDPKTTALVAEIADLEWRTTESEIDALFLESELIKRYQPKWNILLRDDKTVIYVRIDLKSDVPYVSTTRTPLDDEATYIGPFYGASAIKQALRILRKTFPFYDKPYTGKKTLYTDLKLTPGLEIGQSSPRKYKNDLKKLILCLENGRHAILPQLETEMQEAVNHQDFETATTIRNQIFSLRELQRKIIFSNQEFLDLSKDYALTELQSLLKLPNPPHRIEGYDISHHGGQNAVASMVVFTNGVSDRSQYRKFKIKQSKNNDFANLAETIERRLKHPEWPLPDVFLIDGGIPQLNYLHDLLKQTKIPYLGLSERFENIIIPISDTPKPTFQEISLPDSSHLLKLLQRIRDEAHRFAITYHTYLKNKNMLK